jgi:effector-binding domain-containing protein
MKKNLLATGLLAISFLSAQVQADHRATSGSQEIKVQQVEPFAYVCLQEKGSFDKIQETIARLIQEMQGQNRRTIDGHLPNSPGQVKPKTCNGRSPSRNSQALIQPPLQKKEWNYTQVVAGLHQGPYEKTGETIGKMMEWMEANGYVPAGAVLERYQDMNPDELKPEELKTEVWIPCQKKTIGAGSDPAELAEPGKPWWAIPQ